MKLPSLFKNQDFWEHLLFALLCGGWMVIGFHVARGIDLFGIYGSLEPDSAFTHVFGYRLLQFIERWIWFLPFGLFYMHFESRREGANYHFDPTNLKEVGGLMLASACLVLLGLWIYVGLHVLIVDSLDFFGRSDWAAVAHRLLSATKR